MTADSPPSEPAALVAALDEKATRHETPCGDGVIVWRQWGSGPPVVLAHGAQGSWKHFIRNINALAAHRTVLAVDLPGHGQSALPPEPHEHATNAPALAEGLRRIVGRIMGEHLPVDLVGFSFGASALAHMAAWHPEVARRLIIIGAGGLGTPAGDIRLGPARGLTGEARKAQLRANLLGLMLHHPDSADDLAVHLLETDARAARMHVPGLVMPDRLIRILPELACPVDAIWGEFDRPHPDPARHHAILRGIDARAEMRVIPGAGHWAMYENADAFNAALLKMLHSMLRSKVRD